MIKIWKFRDSDHEQFEKLVQPHIKRLYTLAYRFTGQRDDAEDLVQDVLLKIYPRLEEIQSIERLGRGWRGVLYRQFVDKWRSKDRSIVQLVADEADLESVDDEVQGPAGNAADPANYEVDSGTLTLDGIVIEEAIGVTGFPTPFGSAPPDFTAQTVVNYKIGFCNAVEN